MRVNPRKYGREREGLLAPLALRHRLNYLDEVAAPGTSPQQIAFQLVCCGADLLSGLRYPDAIPTADRKVAKSSAKVVASRFQADEGRQCAVLLARAFATWYIEMMEREDDPGSAAVHARLRDLIQQFFPLDADDLEHVESLRAEYRVLDDHEITGRVPATGWYMALLDPEFAEGRDVDTDPELIRAQMRYASRCLRLGADCRAIAICVGAAAYRSLEPNFFYPNWPGHEILTYDHSSLSWWTDCAADWHACGERALAAEVV